MYVITVSCDGMIDLSNRCIEYNVTYLSVLTENCPAIFRIMTLGALIWIILGKVLLCTCWSLSLRSLAGSNSSYWLMDRTVNRLTLYSVDINMIIEILLCISIMISNVMWLRRLLSCYRSFSIQILILPFSWALYVTWAYIYIHARRHFLLKRRMYHRGLDLGPQIIWLSSVSLLLLVFLWILPWANGDRWPPGTDTFSRLFLFCLSI